MRSLIGLALVMTFSLAVAPGCKRPPANAFPGTNTYASRIETFKITPKQAHEIAYKAAQKDGQLQYISRTPIVVVKRWYVFGIPQPSGADLRGYHVNGDTGEVKFMNEKKTIPNPGR